MSGNMISIRNNFPAVAAKLDRLAMDVGNKAMRRALNTTIDQGKTQMAREISKVYRLSVAKVKERLEVSRAVPKDGGIRCVAILKAAGKRPGRSMNLIWFVDGFVTLAQARRRSAAGEGGTHTLRRGGTVRLAQQLRFQIKRSGGKKMLKGAFIGNKGRTIFIRTGDQRLPIKPIHTVAVPSMFNSKAINNIVRSVMLKRFETNFNRELRSVLKGYVK